ncbi:hypothetical protein GCM10025865_28010 [Paraoerskovia sediminicola]|uniref:Uncharacterized protein n=1 Tax=Paraoerskovia sediminicola TaxID=1138587 RepID=A0ABM8G5T1_9CELL|nr:hypothetical protein [Paraoerskovia sediminicola]BDZ43502.1 hypothetical protein GCM10025865_28010 [Paraoerskovia sediminicola]
MSRIFWVGVGVTVTVIVVVQGRKIVARFAPAAVVESATDQINDAGARGLEAVRVFRAEFTDARRRREAELRGALLADGQPAPEDVRAARSARHRRADGPAVDDEDELGYSFF